MSKKNEYFMPGIDVSESLSPKEATRHDLNWTIRTIQQGNSVGLIGDGAEIWKLPDVGNSVVGSDVRVAFDDCSGKYLGKDVEGQDRWSGPTRVEGKLTADKPTESWSMPSFDGEHGISSKTTCELPVSTGNERSNVGKDFVKVGEQWVPACTRNCHIRGGKCYHGVEFFKEDESPFIPQAMRQYEDGQWVTVNSTKWRVCKCVLVCEQCRTPHRERRKRGEGKLGDAWTCQKYTQSKCLSPMARIHKDKEIGEFYKWEKTLKANGLEPIGPLGKEIQHASKNIVVTFEDFDGTRRIQPQQSNRDSYVGAIGQLSTHGLNVSDVSILKSPTTNRVVPTWTLNDEFVDGFVKWLYSRDTQVSKRQAAKDLIYRYWRLFETSDDLAKHFETTKAGLEVRLTRLKDKAKEFSQTVKIEIPA
jgi:hypothetical protein